jgi:hypothetical protein
MHEDGRDIRAEGRDSGQPRDQGRGDGLQEEVVFTPSVIR